jgi:hypothetical protein
VLAAAAAAVTLPACGKSDAIATLASADGPVERQHGDAAAWKSAAIGAKFYLGDAARTADSGAGLDLTGGATIAMQPHTVLRFGGDKGTQKISVELGAIDLAGTGAYGLDVGQVNLTNNSKIRITATGGGKSSVELSVGTAEIVNGGKTLSLELGKAIEVTAGGGIELGASSVTPVAKDAGVPDAAVPVDAAAGSDDNVAQVQVTGGRAETQAPDEKTWKPLPAGSAALGKGTKLRLGGGTTAKLTSKGTTLEMAGGSRATIGDDLELTLDAGGAKATVPASGSGSVAVPAGAIALAATPQTGTEVRLDIGGRETKVSVVRGGTAKLTGGGGTLEMTRGESASIAHPSGAIHPIEAIPTYFDFRIGAGDSLTVHDPKPPTAIQFQFLGKCTTGGVIELDRDSNFRTAQLSAGQDNANLMVQPGSWAYRLRCSQGDVEGKQVAAGHIYVVRDDGRRPLPKLPNVNPIDADGRNWSISYQSLVPNVEVHYKGASGGGALRLHLAQGGKDQTFDNAKGDKITVPGASLKEGSYLYWFDVGGVKQDKVSTLKIDFDQTAPQVYIEAPPNGQPFGATIDVKGAVLQGWSAAVEGVDVPIDKQRRFSAQVPPPPGQALAIRLSHPQRGVHYYLRRGK